MYRLLSESLLGLQREGDALILRPCIPAEWNDYRIDYRFGASVYRIRIHQLDPAAFRALGSIWHSDRGLQIEALDTGGFRIPLRDEGADQHIALWLERGRPIAPANR